MNTNLNWLVVDKAQLIERRKGLWHPLPRPIMLPTPMGTDGVNTPFTSNILPLLSDQQQCAVIE